MRSFILSPEQYGQMKQRYPKFNEPWTAEEEEELRRMDADGRSRAEMSEQLGRTANAIKFKLQSMGLYVPKPAAKPWTAVDEEALVRMYRSGVPFADLAAAFGRSENAIVTRLVRLRVVPAPDSPAAEIKPVMESMARRLSASVGSKKPSADPWEGESGR